MWIRRTALVVAVITVVLLLCGTMRGLATEGGPSGAVPFDSCEFLPWWPGCN